MNTTSLLTLNPSSKSEIDSFVSGIVEAVDSGVLNPLEAHVRLTAMEKACEIIKKQIREAVVNESGKYGEKKFLAFGSEIEKAETGVKYDFSTCGDSQWIEATENENTWGEKRKEREVFLKTLKSAITIVDQSTGEVMEIHPPIKSSSSFIKVTMK